MREQPPLGPSDGNTSSGPSRNATSGPPRWVKMFGVIGLVLVLIFVLLHLIGGGLGRHGLHEGGPDDHDA